MLQQKYLVVERYSTFDLYYHDREVVRTRKFRSLELAEAYLERRYAEVREDIIYDWDYELIPVENQKFILKRGR